MKASLGTVAVIAMSISLGSSAFAQVAKQSKNNTEAASYVRPAGKGFAHETEIRLRQIEDAAEITSTTRRSDRTLTLASRFDSSGKLHDAVVTIDDGEQKLVATVTVVDGKARVARRGKPAVVLDCPSGVIVTSAPDWTDAFLIVRRYEPHGTKEQRFEGLWVHSSRDPLRLTFTATRLGVATVSYKEKEVELSRLRLVLRNRSRYVAWRNNQGQLVRLVPEGKPRQGIVLAGWEETTAGLKP